MLTEFSKGALLIWHLAATCHQINLHSNSLIIQQFVTTGHTGWLMQSLHEPYKRLQQERLYAQLHKREFYLMTDYIMV